jgi:NADPH2:quinone reductase
MTGTNRTVAGFNLIHLWDRPDLFASSIDVLLALAEEGRIRPLIGGTYPLGRAGEAQAFLQSRRSTGKVVLLRGSKR